MADPKDFRGLPKYDNLLGKVRPTDREGVDVTEQVKHSVKVTMAQWWESVVGKFRLVDHEGGDIAENGNLKVVSKSLEKAIASIPVSRIVSCPSEPIEIPGILAADALDAGDCMGTIVRLKVPKRGIIYSATFYDLDDEGSQVDLEIFKHHIVQTASDAAWSPSDVDMAKFVTELAFYNFDDHVNSQTSELLNIGKAYTAAEGFFSIQAVCRGTPNIAAGAFPRFQLQILSDDPDFVES